MAKRGPGKAHREGLTVIELFKMFPDDAAVETWFEDQRWPEGRFCSDSGATNTVAVAERKPMLYRCRDCRNHFSVRKGTVIQSSKNGLQKRVVAIYMMTTGFKGMSSMKLYREVSIRQATARFLFQRIREGFDQGDGLPFPGPVEADEKFIGGKHHNMPKAKRARPARRGGANKAVIAGVKDRATNRIAARPVTDTSGDTLKGFVKENAAPGAMVYTDENVAYKSLPRHETVHHTKDECVDPETGAGTQGIESFWLMLKHGYHGTYHHLSAKHLPRYVSEFAGRHNIRDLDTVAQMSALARGMVGKRFTYRELVA